MEKIINRADNKNHLWNPPENSRVYSLHSVDGKPTSLNSNPILAMSYNADKRARLLSPPLGKRKRKLNFTLEVKAKKRKSTENLSVLPKAAHSESTKHAAETPEQCASDFNLSSQIIDSGDPPSENCEVLDDQKQHYEATIKNLEEKINSLGMQVYNL